MDIILISDIPQALLMSLIPSINTNTLCFIVPAVILLIFHFIIFQKDVKACKADKNFRIITLLILYFNIAVTVVWVSSVENKLGDAYKIADGITKYYDINRKYPENIDSILQFNGLEASKKNYNYSKGKVGGFWLSFQSQEMGWAFFEYKIGKNKFTLDNESD